METHEELLLKEIEETIENGIPLQSEQLAKLLKNHKKIQKRFDKIVWLSDMQQSELMRLNKELDHYKNRLEEKVQEQVGDIRALNAEIVDTQKEVVFTMGMICESRSKETGNHVKRVAEYSRIFALKLGIDAEEAELIKESSPMHDVGKVAIPDAILKKPGKLSAEEFKVMESHTELGYQMLKHSHRPILKAAATIAYEHHEKWDGSGYPRGLKGTDIHIYGRITSVADVFDALGSSRYYKKAWEDPDIITFFKKESGIYFDPQLVEIFLKHYDDFCSVRDRYQDF